jgi:hypothetical protein
LGKGLQEGVFLWLEGFDFDDNFYGIFTLYRFFKEIADGTIRIVFVGSCQIFITIDLSGRGGEE